MNRLSLLSGAAIATCIAAIGTTACAQSERAFDIPAGPLGDALNAYATQSSQQIFFSTDMVSGLRTPGLHGRFTTSGALERLLAGSGLTAESVRAGVLYIQRSGTGSTSAEAATEVEEVIVTGTLLKATGNIASPVVMIDRAALDRRGLGTVAEVLTDLPQNYAGSGTPIVQLAGSDRQGSNAVQATGVNLRGLGPASTLLLVNGRRVAGTGFRGEFGDVSALPSAAVERVDVLLDGASALYGADAVAGVVNVILRRSFDGQESRLRVSAARGGGEDVIASHLLGRSWNSGTAYVSYEYQHTHALSSIDRDFTADADLRPFGGTDYRNIFSGPGNIVAFSPTAGAYVSQYAIRPNTSGTAQGPGDFVAGTANLQAASLGADLQADQERHSVYGRLRQSLGDRLDLSADIRFNQREYAFAGPASIGLFVVTRANPFFVSPTAAASHVIGYSFRNDLGAGRQIGSSESLGVTAGADYDLGGGWSLDGYLAWAEERGKSGNYGRVNTRLLNEALGTTPDDPVTLYRAATDGFFNPFGAGGANGRAVLDFISSGFTEAEDRSGATSANLLLEGPVITLPGGALQMALGAQVRRETFDTRTLSFASTAAPVSTVTPRAERSIAAVFAEARIPLVGPGNARPGIRSLDLSIAGRFEDYDDFGTTTNPKLGVVWSPATNIAIRASWGTSFRAASLPQIHDAAGNSVTTLRRADGASVLSLYLYGGNPDLEPETAETFSAGVDWGVPDGLTLGLGYFDTEFTDRIAQPVTENLAGALTDLSLVPFVTRISPATNAGDRALIESYINRPDYPYGSFYPADAFGAILDGRWVNTGTVRVRGIDLSARYPIDVGWGLVVLDASASLILDYETQTTPAAAVRDVVDLVGYPTSLRSRAGGSWTIGDVAFDAHWNHVPDYRDRSGRTIRAWDTLDAQAGWSPSTGGLGGLRLALVIQNILDADPPFYDAATGFGFDPGQASLLGRVIALSLTKRW